MNLSNKHIKIHFKNGLTVEGIVIEWTDGKSIIKSLASEDLMVIHQTLENVMMFRVLTEKQKIEPSSLKQMPDVIFEEEENFKSDPKLEVMKLVELRKLQLKEEKEAIAKALRKSFVPDGNIKDHYVYPDFTKLKSSNSFSSQNSRNDASNYQELSRMSRKKSKSK